MDTTPQAFWLVKQAEKPAPLASKGSRVAAADFAAAGSAAPRAKKPLPFELPQIVQTEQKEPT